MATGRARSAALAALALFGAAALALGTAWWQRRALAEWLALRDLRARGVPAELRVARLELRGAELSGLKLGAADAPDLTLAHARLAWSWQGLRAGRLDAVTLRGLRVRARLDERGVQLGALDALINADTGASAAPPVLPFLEARLEDAEARIESPHGALRVYVMGARGANREPATPDDIAQMAAIAEEAVRAGALGFSTSRTLNHRTADGDPTPTLTAASDELTGIAQGLGRAGAGVLQVVSDFADPSAETQMLAQMVRQSGRPLSFSLLQSDRAPEAWRALLSWVSACNAQGLPVKAQTCGRPVGLLLGLQLTLNPFSAHPAYARILHLPFEARLAAMREPQMRQALLGDAPSSDNPFVKAVLRNYAKMFLLSDPPDYEPPAHLSLGAQAQARGMRPEELAYEWTLAEDGRAMILFPFLNYAHDSLDAAYEMMQHPSAILGLGDGGAHVGMICDGSFPTSMLTHWTRDRRRGPKLSLPWVVRAQTRTTAEAVGLLDRGLIKPGYKGDLNVIDYDRLTLHRPGIAHDLPAGGRRLVQRARGYTATIVSGQITYRDGVPTNALPGRLIRGAQGL